MMGCKRCHFLGAQHEACNWPDQYSETTASSTHIANQVSSELAAAIRRVPRTESQLGADVVTVPSGVPNNPARWSASGSVPLFRLTSPSKCQ